VTFLHIQYKPKSPAFIDTDDSAYISIDDIKQMVIVPSAYSEGDVSDDPYYYRELRITTKSGILTVFLKAQSKGSLNIKQVKEHKPIQTSDPAADESNSSSPDWLVPQIAQEK
jgi:hypothetical protein